MKKVLSDIGIVILVLVCVCGIAYGAWREYKIAVFLLNQP